MCGELVKNPLRDVVDFEQDLMPSGVSLEAHRRSQKSCLQCPILSGFLLALKYKRGAFLHLLLLVILYL